MRGFLISNTLNFIKLDITIDKIDKTEALIKIKVKEDDYQHGVSQKIKDFSKKANLKGFRPGKVPPGLIRKMYGKSFLAEEINKILSDQLNQYLQNGEEQFLGEPIPNEEQTAALDWENQKDFEFEYNIGFAEQFDLKLDKKVKVDFAKIKVDDKAIDETVDNLRNQFGELSNPDTVSEKDTIYGSVRSADESINQEVSIDTKELDKAYIKKVIGLKVDDQLELDVKKAFKDKEYFPRISSLRDDELKAVKHKLAFVIKGINHTNPAEVNQDLFDKTFGKDAVKSEEEFRIKVSETISKNYDQEAENLFYHRVREHFTEKTKINLPNAFLRKWLLKTNDKLTEEQLEKEYDHYVKELKWSLIRNKISKDHEIKVEHEEVKDEAKKMILQQFGGAGIAEQLGDQLDQFADNYLQGENGENYMKVFNQVQNNKIFVFIREQITAKEKAVSLEEFRKLA
ncbi:MAG: trigger factor [Cyclobacteriaceae bacterium]|nr:trigger factor [Cyclobacteriaceae bacterium HetDA_MAG_MS6]